MALTDAGTMQGSQPLSKTASASASALVAYDEETDSSEVARNRITPAHIETKSRRRNIRYILT
jgi:hypothetical protein